MKKLSKAEEVSTALKSELKKPGLTAIRQIYLTQKIVLIEEFINHRAKQKR